MQPGSSVRTVSLSWRRKSIASRFSRPPYRFAQPLAGPAAVVEVQHRRDGVDAQAVDVELVHPEQRVGDEEVAHLRPAVVEDQRSPVGVLAEPRVFVLVQRGSVEAAKREIVLGEVRGHPVEQHADAGAVACVDEKAEVVRRAVARRGREVARHLISPRARERVLRHRQQLDVREPQPPSRARRAAARSRDT